MPTRNTAPQPLGIFEQQQQEIGQLWQIVDSLQHEVAFLRQVIPPRMRGYQAAAEYTGRSVRTLERLVQEKRIPYEKEGKTVIFATAELQKYMKSRTIRIPEQRRTMNP